jgi:small subunit ribosomal protein S8
MSRTDFIGDCFTMIRNAIQAKKEDLYIPHSVGMATICGILKDEGYLDNFKEVDLEKFKKIRVYLKYIEKNKNAITEIRRLSRPGRRVYMACADVPRALNGYGITIVSTSSGLLTDKQAREKGVGGEIVGQVW